MITRRDEWLLGMLMINASLGAVTSSAYLAEVASRPVVAIFGLISAAISAATGVFVAVTNEPRYKPPGGISPGQRPE